MNRRVGTICSGQAKANPIPELSMVAEVADAVLEGLGTRHATIRQKKRALVVFPATGSCLNTYAARHGKRKTTEDKRNGTRMKKARSTLAASTFRCRRRLLGEYEKEEWSCCFPGFLVVEADLKTDGWLLSIGYTSLAVVGVGVVVVVVVVLLYLLPKFLCRNFK